MDLAIAQRNLKSIKIYSTSGYNGEQSWIRGGFCQINSTHGEGYFCGIKF